jgi:hypothetical protein
LRRRVEPGEFGQEFAPGRIGDKNANRDSRPDRKGQQYTFRQQI